MSKKDLSSDELDTLRRSSNHTTVISTPTAHHFFSCTVVAQSRCSLVVKANSHTLTPCTCMAQVTKHSVCVSPKNTHTSSRNVVHLAALDDTTHGHSFLTFSWTSLPASRTTLRRSTATAEWRFGWAPTLYNNGGYGQWRSANKRRSTNICSRSWSLRNSANTRRHACCSIAWETLWGPRIFPWVVQRSKTTFDQRGDNNCMKTDNFVPLVVPGWPSNSGTSSSSASPPQDSARTSSSPAPDRSDEPAPGNFGRPFARSSLNGWRSSLII